VSFGTLKGKPIRKLKFENTVKGKEATADFCQQELVPVRVAFDTPEWPTSIL
jgi:hypothetical protein